MIFCQPGYFVEYQENIKMYITADRNLFIIFFMDLEQYLRN